MNQPNLQIQSNVKGDKRAIGIACRLDSPEALDVVQFITDYLLKKSERILYETRISSKFMRHLACNLENMTAERVKFIISVGGDGTVLRVVQNLPRSDVPPILGVNLGSVGFLDETDANHEHLKRDLDRVLSSEYRIEYSARLSTFIGNHKLPIALNEVLIITSKPSKVLYASVKVDGTEFTASYLDGLIIATHTGSTAYALSAGGCLLDPRLNGFEIVPLNPFVGTGIFRPLMVPMEAVIEIKLQRPRLNGLVIIDGQREFKVAPEVNIRIQRAKMDIAFIRFENQVSGYFHKLRKKILFNRKLTDNSPEN